MQASSIKNLMTDEDSLELINSYLHTEINTISQALIGLSIAKNTIQKAIQQLGTNINNTQKQIRQALAADNEREARFWLAKKFVLEENKKKYQSLLPIFEKNMSKINYQTRKMC